MVASRRSLFAPRAVRAGLALLNRARNPPEVDAVIVNRDGGESLFAAIRSLEEQEGVNLSLVVVDNDSAPAERERLAREARAARVVPFSRNLGFAGAVNEGIARTRSPYVLLLNNDATIAPDYAARLAARLALDERLAAAQGLVLDFEGSRVDTAGIAWTDRGEAVPLLAGAELSAAPPEAFEVAGVSATAALYRREALAAVAPQGQVFDDSFFALLRGRRPLAPPGARGMALRLRSRGAGEARGGAHRRSHAVPPGAVDGAQPLADSLPKLRAAAPARELRTPAARRPRARAPARLEGGGPAFSRLAAAPARGAPVPRGDGKARRVAGPGVFERGAVEIPVVDLAVLVVSWSDAADLLEAISSLAAARDAIPAGGPSVSLTVVLNGPTGIRREDLVSRWPGATLIFNDENRGFGPAVNQAALHSEASALLLVNPDTRAEPEALSAVARGFRQHPEAAALAPRLLDFGGSGSGSGAGTSARLAPPGQEDQFTFQLRGLPGLASDARELLLLDHLLPNNAGRRRFRYADRDRARPFAVEQAAAAALAVRADAFRAVGGFDERFVPAWFEDVDLCARLAPLGKILYWPEARFEHRGGVSSRRLGYSRFLPIYYRNALLYRRLHYGRAARALYRLLLPAGMLLRLAALPFRGSDPRPKGESARAYLRVSSSRARAFRVRIPNPKSRILHRMTDVSIVVVTHDSADDLPASLASAAAQRGIEAETIVVDAASRDASAELARRVHPGARVIELRENVGFSAAMNAGIEASRGRYVLALNPDCRLEPDFSAVLAARLNARPDVGSASGRLLRAEGRGLAATGRLDSAGIVFRATGRHFDRGSEEPAEGRYLDEEEIAGATGAAGFYRREALESARISTGYFDEDFFLYREDADLAWRLRNLGWKCLYVPRAVAYHRRRNLPSRRRRMSALANYHSVKNRFLLRINNQSGRQFVATLVPTLARDFVVLGACLTVERSLRSRPSVGSGEIAAGSGTSGRKSREKARSRRGEKRAGSRIRLRDERRNREPIPESPGASRACALLFAADPVPAAAASPEPAPKPTPHLPLTVVPSFGGDFDAMRETAVDPRPRRRQQDELLRGQGCGAGNHTRRVQDARGRDQPEVQDPQSEDPCRLRSGRSRRDHPETSRGARRRGRSQPHRDSRAPGESGLHRPDSHEGVRDRGERPRVRAARDGGRPRRPRRLRPEDVELPRRASRS